MPFSDSVFNLAGWRTTLNEIQYTCEWIFRDNNRSRLFEFHVMFWICFDQNEISMNAYDRTGWLMMCSTISLVRLTEIDKDCRVPERIVSPRFRKVACYWVQEGKRHFLKKKHVSDFVLIWDTFGVKPAAGGNFLRIRGLEILNFLYKNQF